MRGAGSPRPEWLSANRDILLMQVKNSIRTEVAPARAWSTENLWQFLDVFLPAHTVYYVVRPAVAVMLIVGLMFGGWITTVSASYNSLPGEYLYAVKMATEAVQVAVAPKPVETKLHAEFAVRRAQEVAQIVAQSDSTPEKVKKVETAVKSLQKELDSAKGGLKDLKENGSKLDAAQAAKVVGEKAVEVQRVIEQTKNQVAPANAPVVVVTPATAAAAKDALNAVNNESTNSTKGAVNQDAGANALKNAGVSIVGVGADTNTAASAPVKELSALKESLKSAGAAAEDASTKAIQVLVDTHKEDKQSVSSEDVKSAVDKKIQSVEEKMQSVNSQLQSIVATSTPAVSATAVGRAETKILEKAVEKVVEPVKQTTENAKSTLREARDLSQNQNFDGALDKLQQVKDIVKAAEVSVEKIQIVGSTSTFAGVGVVGVKTEGKDAAKNDSK